jgi:hypothetical protein
MTTSLRLASLLALALAAAPLAAGCADDDGGAGTGGGGTGGEAPDDGDDLPPDTEPDPDPKPSGCPRPTQGPTIHEASAIEADETWSADASPHIVTGFIAVRRATLTIEPCAVVQFEDPYAGFTIAYPGSPTTGRLVAEGTADKPILFEGKDRARWGHILVEAGGEASLAHLTIQDGGGYEPRGGSLYVYGDGTLPTRRDVKVDHVTVRESLGAGVVLDRLGAFTAHTDALTITASGSEEMPYPLYTDEHGLHTLPRGAYTGNVVDKIYVNPTSHLAESATMKNVGVPYQVGSFPEDDFVVASGDEAAPAILTIEAGVRIEMHPGTTFAAEHFTGEFAASGAIVAEGTAEEPIVFTSSAASPAPGDWRGLWFGGVALDANRFEHVRLEYTGADCGCILIGCSDIPGYEGAVIFSQQPPRAFFSNSTIAHGSANGVVLGYRGSEIDFREGFTFEALEGCEQTAPHPGSCPNPLPACQ